MNLPWEITLAWLLASGTVGFGLMGFDKGRAKGHGRRVRERTFYEIAIVGGVFGILAGSVVFHHKTVKSPFIELTVIVAVLWVVLLFQLAGSFGSPVP